MDAESETDPKPTSVEFLAKVDELDRLEARRNALGPRFLRRNIFLTVFSVAGIVSLIPVLAEYTPLEYGLPWFVLVVAAVVGAKGVTALVRGLPERRELDEQVAVLRQEMDDHRVGPGSGGELPNKQLLLARRA